MRTIILLTVCLLSGSLSAAEKRKRTKVNQPAAVVISDLGLLPAAVVRVRSSIKLTVLVSEKEKQKKRTIALTDVTYLRQMILDKGLLPGIVPEKTSADNEKQKPAKIAKPSPWHSYGITLILKDGEIVTGVLAKDTRISVEYQAGKLSKRVAALNKGGQAMWDLTREAGHNGAELENRQVLSSLQKKIAAMQAKSRIWKTFILKAKDTGKPGATLRSLNYLKTIDFRAAANAATKKK